MLRNSCERNIGDEQMNGDWHCNIEKVNNGYVMTTRQILNDDTVAYPKEVFEENDADYGDEKAFVYMVYALADYFAISNLKINIFDNEGNEVIVDD